MVEPPPDLEDLVQREFASFPMGLVRMHAYLRRKVFTDQLGYKATKTLLLKVYKKFKLFRFHRESPVLHPLRCRYVAQQVNLIWHTDLHLYKRLGQWVMAFLDDASRKIIASSFLEDKSSASTAALLETALGTVEKPPFAVWTDNGTEFKGHFDELLVERGVRHVRTTPYNPEQNGKIERFWPTIEQWKEQGSLEAWIAKYNARPHTALPSIEDEDGTMVRMTPDEAYEELMRWPDDDWPPMWLVNGHGYPFPRALKEADPTVEYDAVADDPPVGAVPDFERRKPRKPRRPRPKPDRSEARRARKNQQ
jgi:transposase InsO family protein